MCELYTFPPAGSPALTLERLTLWDQRGELGTIVRHICLTQSQFNIRLSLHRKDKRESIVVSIYHRLICLRTDDLIVCVCVFFVYLILMQLTD